jgi:hypothetical protein
MAPVAVIPAPVVAITEEAIIITPLVVIPFGPVRSVIPSIVRIPWKIIVVGIEVVIDGSINGWD